MSNLISVLFIGEMERLLNEDEKKDNLNIEMEDIADTKTNLLIDKIDNKEEFISDKKDENKEAKNNINTNAESDANEQNNDDNLEEIEENENENTNENENENEKENKNENNQIVQNEDEEMITAAEEYENNKKEMNNLDLKYYFFNILLTITKFYWLFLFINLGIIFTTRDLSVILILYILIFGAIYIGMFHKIITKLNAYIQKKSFFISRLIRYNLVELSRHYQQNRYFRNLGFQYLLMLCLISYLFFYTFGIFHRVQNGCNYENNVAGTKQDGGHIEKININDIDGSNTDRNYILLMIKLKIAAKLHGN
jgi:hypothetical protein